MYEIKYAEGWDEHYSKFDKNTQKSIWKKTQSLKEKTRARHMRFGLPYFVIESGQYRICFVENSNIRTIVFAGTHKQYEKWYKDQ